MLQGNDVHVRHGVRVVGIAAGVPCEAFAARAGRTRGSTAQTACPCSRRNRRGGGDTVQKENSERVMLSL